MSPLHSISGGAFESPILCQDSLHFGEALQRTPRNLVSGVGALLKVSQEPHPEPQQPFMERLLSYQEPCEAPHIVSFSAHYTVKLVVLKFPWGN